jgi:hypothetical protein
MQNALLPASYFGLALWNLKLVIKTGFVPRSKYIVYSLQKPAD